MTPQAEPTAPHCGDVSDSTWRVEDGLPESSEDRLVEEDIGTMPEQKKHYLKPLVKKALPVVLVAIVIVAGVLLFRPEEEKKAVTSSLEEASSIESPTAQPVAVVQPTLNPTLLPTSPPTRIPSIPPSTAAPTAASKNPSTVDSNVSVGTNSTTNGTNVTFAPGDLSVKEAGLILSRGLRARVIAMTGRRIVYFNGTKSSKAFHGYPDFGATFPDTRPNNIGGWVYVSNSEIDITGKGGVGASTFDKDGNVIDYRMVLEGTTMNCGGGRTPWYVASSARKGRLEFVSSGMFLWFFGD